MNPLFWLLKYLRKAGIPDDSTAYIFQRIIRPNAHAVARLADDDKPVTYNSMRAEMKKVLSDTGENEKLYGWHSARSGGATAAANAGISERLIKVQGRWVADLSVAGYIQDSLQQRLNIGL